MKLKQKLRRRESFTGFLFCLPSIVGMFAFFVIPFGVSVYMSFTESMGNNGFIGLKNYINVLGSAAFKLAAWNTFRFNAVAVPAILIVSLFIALLLYKKLKGYNFFRTVFIFPLVLPLASVVLFFQIIFGSAAITTDSFTALLVLYLWKNSGYNIILFLAALNSIPRAYYEASEIDGANKLTQLFKITLPLIVPHTFFIVVISIINSFKAFREAFILFGAHPDQSIYMIQHFMNNNFQNLNYIRLSVGAILIFLVIFVLVLIMLIMRGRSGDIEL